MFELTKVSNKDRNITVYPMGMREMQHKVFEKRDSQYLLIKAPPAAGKSRALMYVSLDKLNNQGIKKVIVTVPERSIGGSFKNTDLKENGFPYNWEMEDQYNLCSGISSSKTGKFLTFLEDKNSKILVCTHSTLRSVIENIDLRDFNHCLIAIDEFHHVSVSDTSVLGNAINKIIDNSNAHIVAMTGSYVRGDGVSILTPEHESLFDVVSYSYYDQLCSYQYLKDISFDYHFYSGLYTDAIKNSINLNKKTIIYIPNVNSLAATFEKNEAVDRIYDIIGKEVKDDIENGIKHFETKHGTIVKVANFVNDNKKERDRYLKYASDLSHKDAIDIIITLNLAKEGFDWPWCEELLVVNYRDSITETVQIIGRVSRDCPGKETGKFIYLIPRPNVADADINIAVNDMLKVVTLVLLMEQIMTPTVYFTTDKNDISELGRGKTVIVIDENNAIGATKRALDIINQHQDDIILETIEKCPATANCIFDDDNAQVLAEIELPNMIKEKFPQLNIDETEFIAKSILTAAHVKKAGLVEREDIPEGAVIEGGICFNMSDDYNARFLKINDRYVNIDGIDINLIKEVNPLKADYEVLSKKIDPALLTKIKARVKAKKVDISDNEIITAYPKIMEFRTDHGRWPSPMAEDKYEERLGMCFERLKILKAEQAKQNN